MTPAVPAREHPLHETIVAACLTHSPLLETITIRPLPGGSARSLCVTGTLEVLLGRELEITVWAGTRSGALSRAAEQPAWIRVLLTEDGETLDRTFEADTVTDLEDALEFLGEEEVDWVAGELGPLFEILLAAGDDHIGLGGTDLINHYIGLNAACATGLLASREEEESAFAGYDDDEDGEESHEGHSHAGMPPREPWYTAVDNFTAQCRYGFLRHILLQESPYGAADVSAEIRPPGLDHDVTVKVFTHQGGGDAQAGHWYSAGDAMCSAHGEDIDIIGLVAGFPVESQGFIAHSLEHLHSTVHTVEKLLQARMDDIVEALVPVLGPGEESLEIVRSLYAVEFADTIAGLNGIARLHTGAAPAER